MVDLQFQVHRIAEVPADSTGGGVLVIRASKYRIDTQRQGQEWSPLNTMVRLLMSLNDQASNSPPVIPAQLLDPTVN